MFRILEIILAMLVVIATLATCATAAWEMDQPNGVRRAASQLARKGTLSNQLFAVTLTRSATLSIADKTSENS